MHRNVCLLLSAVLLESAVGLRAAEPIIAPGAKPVMLQETGAGEGPAWHPELGLLTSGEGNINRRDRDGKCPSIGSKRDRTV